MYEVTEALINIKRTASGPGDIPYWLFRDFGYQCLPSATIQFHFHGRKRPPAKEMPLSSRNKQRPISLTNIILRLFEWLVYKNDVSTVCTNHIDLDSFAHRKGLNYNMASQKSLPTWLKRKCGLCVDLLL